MADSDANPISSPETGDAMDEHWRQLSRGNVAWDRLLAFNDALEIIAATGQDPRGIEEVQQMRDRLDEKLTALRRMGPEEDFARALGDFEGLLTSAEVRLMTIDAAVPFPLLRRVFDVHRFAEQNIARYVSVLSRYVDDAAERRDRIDFLATRLFSTRVAHGRLAMRPYADVYQILRALMRDEYPTQPGNARGVAVAFFRDAIRRMEEFHSVDDLFDSGFYVDVRSYKISLRDEFLDPDVLYAAAELNTAIHNRMQDFADLQNLPSDAIRERIDEQESQVKDIFQPEDSFGDKNHVRFNAERLKARETARKLALDKKHEARTQWRRFVLQIATAIVVLIGGVGAVSFFYRGRSGLQATDAATLEDISPLLQRGFFSNKDPKVFIGHIDSSQWLVMSPSQRLAAAKEFADHLLREDCEQALVYRDGVLAIQIERHRVIMVE